MDRHVVDRAAGTGVVDRAPIANVRAEAHYLRRVRSGPVAQAPERGSGKAEDVTLSGKWTR